MSTLRVSNIEAKADASSPSVNEKIKITNSNGDVLVHVNGETSGITTIGINTTGESVSFDSNQNATFSGIVTSTSGFIGDLTGNVTGNLTGTASTATAAATAYGLSGAPTLSGITSISTANLTVNGNAYPATGPLSNRNLIINGAMQVAQRGTSHSTQGYGSIDRFTRFSSGTTVTMSQETLSSGSPYDEGFRYFLRLSNSGTSTATNAYNQIDQQIEAQNIAQSGWNYTSSTSYITCSFWVRSSVAGTYYAQYRAPDAGTYVYNDSFTLSANTWTKVTQSIPGNSNLVVNNDNGSGLRLVVVPYYGTGYTDNSVTDETWYQQTSTTWFRDFAQNWQNTDGATFDITGVQIEVGTVATPFEHRSYGDELARCQRYYQVTGESVSGGPPTNAYGGYIGTTYPNNATSYGTARFHTPMRAIPNVVLYDNTGTSGTATQNGTANGISASASHITPYGFTVVQRTTGVWTDDARYTIYAGYTANAEL